MKSVLLGPAKEYHFPRAGVNFYKESGLWHAAWVHEPKAHRFAKFAKAALADELGMAGWTDEREAAILDDYFRSAGNGSATHVALGTTNPSADDEAGTGWVEVTNANAYARTAFTRNATNWGAAAGTAPVISANLLALTFPTASGGNWGTVTNWVYVTSATHGAGNNEFWAALATSKAVDDGDTAEFAIGDLEGKLGDPGDSY